VRAFRAYRVFHHKGHPEGRIVKMEVEALSEGDVLIRNAYSSLNYKDALAIHGINEIITAYPRNTGIDLVGRVARSVDARFKEGDAVIVHGFGIGVDHDGGHAQYARVPGDWVLPLPSGMSEWEAASIGVAGYTAALSIHLMELNGLTPGAGNVLVTGATGGVGSIAIDMLVARGYSVTAVTSKTNERDYLTSLGATEVIVSSSLEMGKRPLEKGMWAGAMDALGGEMLAWLTRTMKPDGVIAAYGNARGVDLSTTVLPFILRGVRLLGIRANSPMPLRRAVWGRIAHDLRPKHLKQIVHEIRLEDLPDACARMLEGGAKGRAVVLLDD
jgi:acrylyl-CoA reductase (NADPH)